MNLLEAYREFRDTLAPLGFEVDDEIVIVALWRDRERHGREPLPADALKRLAELAIRLLTPDPP